MGRCEKNTHVLRQSRGARRSFARFRRARRLRCRLRAVSLARRIRKKKRTACAHRSYLRPNGRYVPRCCVSPGAWRMCLKEKNDVVHRTAPFGVSAVALRSARPWRKQSSLMPAAFRPDGKLAITQNLWWIEALAEGPDVSFRRHYELDNPRFGIERKIRLIYNGINRRDEAAKSPLPILSFVVCGDSTTRKASTCCSRPTPRCSAAI